MASVDPEILSHIEGISDKTRARELYKYYKPNSSTSATSSEIFAKGEGDEESGSFADLNITSNVSSSKISSPDTALTAFAQLVSWRTGVQRAMISVIDAETQYFIAESTKTLDLIDNTKHNPGDELWMGCSQVSKAGRLCERTIAVPSKKPGEGYPAFIVNDLSEDSRFNHLPFVSGPPFLKFYAGTPLITKKGIPIGSLFIVDSRPRPGLSKSDIHFLGTMAATIMHHMEMSREVEEHRRGIKMSRGLASFVEGRAELAEDDVDNDYQDDLLLRHNQKENLIQNSRTASVSSIDRKEKEYSSEMKTTEEVLMIASLQGQSDSGLHHPDLVLQSQSTSHDDTSVSTFPSGTVQNPDLPSPVVEDEESSRIKGLFSRAASLITEAFEITGSVFLDAQKGFSSEYSENGTIKDDVVPVDLRTSGEGFKTGPNLFSTDSKTTTEVHRHELIDLQSSTSSRSSIGPEKSVDLLGFSAIGVSSLYGDKHATHLFSQPEEKFLHSLLKRYPRGKLWTLDEDGSVSSSEDDKIAAVQVVAPSYQEPRRLSHMKRQRLNEEAKILLKSFPGVRQILFVPLWDISRSRWLSACFAWTVDTHRILSKGNELAFLIAFSNSVMAEYSRIGTEIADQKKGDFIGSISHELRSPLHGILASAEFLGEELTEGFSKGLIETIDSCGRTLLDTINHILDFSKINSLEKQWRRSRRIGPLATRPQSGQRNSDAVARKKMAEVPMINLFAEVDVAVVCEEVVEGVFAGHVFQNVTAPTFDMPDIRATMKSNPRRRMYAPDSESIHNGEVAVILDIDVKDYRFTTQPGALRRVIMNILGNALKYTTHGYVQIKLETVEMEDLQVPGSTDTIPRSRMILTVKDTGQGISKDFMRSRLFTPFAQQSSLSSGTGLGLSIVRSIVALLGGKIQIRSEEKKGTEVIVTLPLARELPGGSGNSPPKSISEPTVADPAIIQLRGRVVGKTASLIGFGIEAEDLLDQQSQELFKQSVSNILTSWYGLKIVTREEAADIILVNELDTRAVLDLARPWPGFRKAPVVLALCSHSSRFGRSHVSSSLHKNVGFLAKPVGPVKLARALCQCLDGEPVTPTPGIVNGSFASSPKASRDVSSLIEGLSLSPHTGEVLDNSRMAAGTENARKAIESPAPVAGAEKFLEFPFPVNTALNANTGSAILVEITKGHKISNKDLSHEIHPLTLPKPRQPTLLLVDDNIINLKLLRTFMRKRQYSQVDEAENGLEAVKAFQDRGDGYDIIFMDISMPVLDGFGATRRIREIERARRTVVEASGQPLPTPALIIALTGLASREDHSEAFKSGVDLFLTKPVAFKEVGRMLDNWAANQGDEGD